jgi:N-acetylglucosaminyldiphosphoundecaprenol N-acetyl-beta-D-mannosaminyltransferase
VHGVMECQRDAELRRIHNSAGLVVPDGMPLVWLSWLAGNHHVGRVYGPDLMLACCDASRGRRRHFLYGGAKGVPERLADRLRDRFPGLLIVGAYSPPFHPLSHAEALAVTRQINDAKPDIVWVGLSTPKQERWMAAQRGVLNAPVLVGVGAAFDFHAGLKAQAPRWMRRSGLEWLFRLLTEPRRLWRRYLINNPLFLCRILLQHLGWAKYDL